MRKIILLSFIALVAMVPTAFAVSYVELQSQFYKGAEPVQQVSYSDWHGIGSGFGFFTWTMVNKVWGEVYGGLDYTFSPNIAGGIGFGVETDQDPARYGSYLLVAHRKVAVTTLHEYGGSGHWLRITGAYHLSKLGFGGMHETHLGTGPYFELRAPKVRVWTASLFEELDAPVQVIALQYVF